MTKKHFAIIYIPWLLINLFFLYKDGVTWNGDGDNYLLNATTISQNLQYTNTRFIPYSTYIFFIILIKSICNSVWAVAFLQIAISGVALFCFYKILTRVSSKSIVVISGTLLLVFCYHFQSWNVRIYTESLYGSLLIFFLYFFLKPSYSKKDLLWLFGLFILLFFCRPTTFILSIPLVISIVYSQYKLQRISGLNVVLLFSAFFISLNVFLYFYLTKFDVVQEYFTTNVICGVNETAKDINYNLPPKEMNEYIKMFYFIFNNKLMILKFSWQRFISFFFMTRTYYSIFHNLCLILFDCSYIFILFHKPSLFFDKAKRVFIYGTIFIFTIYTMLTCDEWSGRWIVPIIPFLILIITNGIDNFLVKFKLLNNHAQ